MFQRRKVLLALLETFGSIGKVECQKYMFLLTREYSGSYYDFFPYNFGPYSVTLAEDLEYLETKEYLNLGNGEIRLVQHGFKLQVDAYLSSALDSLKQKYGSLRSDKLTHEVYSRFPYYASRSEIAERILTYQERQKISEYQQEVVTDKLELFTIGYEGRSIDKYLDLLIQNKIALLVDVRKNPLSKKYGFSKRQLQGYCELAKVKYLHIMALGIDSNLRQQLNTPEDYKALFDLYEKNILPKQNEALQLVEAELKNYKRVALTCFEASHIMCHRSVVARHIVTDINEPISTTHL